MPFLRSILSFFALCACSMGALLDAKEIDVYLAEAMAAKKVQPSDACSDEVFLRRVSLVLTGRLPRTEQVLVFLASENPEKRSLMIDALLDSEAYVDYQVLKWGDLLRIKSEFPSNIWPNGVQAYNRWLREQIRANVPYNQMVYDLLTSSGSNFRSPAVNFYRAFQKREPELIADNINLLFLGQRSLPESFPPFFTQLQYKSTREWKEEIVYANLDIPPRMKEVTMPDGTKLALAQGRDFRKSFAHWLCLSDNRAFARAMVNRVWFWLMGRGIIDPPDDICPDNKPTHPELLEELTTQFIAMQYDVRALMRLILNSEAFARSSICDESQKDKLLAAQCYAYYPTTRLTAEQILDAIGDVTGLFDSYVSMVPEPYSYFPSDIRAVQLGDGSVTSAQIELFGRPSRDLSLESDRNNAISAKQVLYLLNSAVVLKKIEASERITQMAKESASAQELMERLYILALGRHPSEEELSRVLALMPAPDAAARLTFARKLVWALFNSSEFLFNH